MYMKEKKSRVWLAESNAVFNKAKKKTVQKREDIVRKQENTMEIQSNPVNM